MAPEAVACPPGPRRVCVAWLVCAPLLQGDGEEGRKGSDADSPRTYKGGRPPLEELEGSDEGEVGGAGRSGACCDAAMSGRRSRAQRSAGGACV